MNMDEPFGFLCSSRCEVSHGCVSSHRNSPSQAEPINHRLVQGSPTIDCNTSTQNLPPVDEEELRVQGSPAIEACIPSGHSSPIEDHAFATRGSSSMGCAEQPESDNRSMNSRVRINLGTEMECTTSGIPLTRLERIQADAKAKYAWESLFEHKNVKQRDSANKIEERQLENVLLTDESVVCCAQYTCNCNCMNKLRDSLGKKLPGRTKEENEEALKDLIWSHRSEVLEHPQFKQRRAQYVANQLYHMNQKVYSEYDDTNDSRIRVSLKIHGVDVCNKAFCNVSGISCNALKVAKGLAKGLARGGKKVCAIEPEFIKISGQQVVTMKDWLIAHAKEGAACEMPTVSSVSDGKEPLSAEYRLYNNTKVAIWRIYSDDICLTSSTPLSYSHFCSVWRNDPYLKKYIRLMRKTENFGKCGLCEYFKSQLCRRLGEEERSQCRIKYSQHLKDMKYERDKYMKHASKAIRKPSEYMSVCIDGMGAFATTQPHLNISTPKDIKGKDRLETQLIGVLVHGARMDFYGVTSGVKHGADVTVECLDQSIKKHLHELESKKKTPPRVLYIQLDNTTKDNKCETVFDYCAYLVHAKFFDKVKVSFLKPGHTHIDVDQKFSVINKYLKSSSSNAVTWPRMQTAIRVAFSNSKMQVSSVPMVLEVRDWTNLFRASCRKIARFAKEDASGEAQHVFVFYVCEKSEGGIEVKMVYKEWHRSSVWCPKPFQVGDQVESSDGTMTRIVNISRSKFPVAGALSPHGKNKKYEYEFTGVDVSGEKIVWQVPPMGIVLLDKAVDLENLKLASIPEGWADVLGSVEKTIGYLEHNITNVLHSKMMDASAVYEKGLIISDYGDGSHLVKLVEKGTTVHVDSERMKILDPVKGVVRVNTEYPCAFTWWKQFFFDQRARISSGHLRCSMATPPLDGERFKVKLRGEVVLEESRSEEDVTVVDSITHPEFTSSQRKRALEAGNAANGELVEDTRPLVGSIGIAAFSYENSSTSDEKYTRNTCPFQVLRHSEESMEFEVKWFYSRQQKYDKNHIWGVWKKQKVRREPSAVWKSLIKEESILMRNLDICGETPKSLVGVERVSITKFKLKKKTAEQAQKVEETYSLGRREAVPLAKRRRVLRSGESDSESSASESE